MNNQIITAGTVFEKGPVNKKMLPTGRDLKAYAMVLLTEGGGQYWDENLSDQEGIKVSQGQVIILFPGLRHRYGRGAGDHLWSEYYLVFNGPIFEQLELDDLLRRDTPILNTRQNQGFVDSFKELVESYQEGFHLHSPHAAIAKVHELLARLYQLNIAPEIWLTRACRELGRDLDKKLSLNELAPTFQMGEQVFRKQFKAQLNISPLQYRLQKRLDYAQELLLVENKGLDWVASTCGFCDQYHFSRIFKKHRKMTPGEFRRLNGLTPREK